MTEFSDRAIAKLKEMAAEHTAQRIDKRPLRRKAPQRSSSLVVYKAISDASAGEVEVKRVDASGSVTGEAVTLDTLSGMDIATDDLVIAVAASDGRMAAYKGGGSTTATLLVAKFDGTRSSKRYTGHLWTDAGTQGAAIQWLFDWGNDPGVDDVVPANNYVQVIACPTWLASNAAYGVVGTYGAKYVAIAPIWGVLR